MVVVGERSAAVGPGSGERSRVTVLRVSSPSRSSFDVTVAAQRGAVIINTTASSDSGRGDTLVGTTVTVPSTVGC